jgi:chlorophyll(ide) b reductase
VRRGVAAAVAALGGRIDALINNAGVAPPGGARPLADTPPADLARVVSTNLAGVALVCASVLEVMAAQPGGGRGHIWNMDGAGAGGRAQPGFAAYSAAKAGVASLTRTLAAEVAAAGLPVGVHTLSPGMVLTPLLLDGAPPAVRATGFNWFAEQPEVAAAFLVPRARSAMAGKGARSTAVRLLTPWSAAGRLLAAPLRRRRFFDGDGTPLYPPSDSERLYGPATAAAAAREAGRAAARSRGLALSYATSMAAGFLLLAAGLLPDWVK